MTNEPSKIATYVMNLSLFGVLDSDQVLAHCLRAMPEEMIVRIVIDNKLLDPATDEGDREILNEACQRLNIDPPTQPH